MKKFVIVTKCPDQVGIIREVASFFCHIGGSIIKADQFTDVEAQIFFARWEVSLDTYNKEMYELEDIRKLFSSVAENFAMEWEVFDSDIKPRILLAVSKLGHCLNDFLFRKDEENFPADIVGVVSNHEDFREKVEWHELPFYHLPISPDKKLQQEKKILDIMSNLNVDLLVLARYMQILSDEMCQHLRGKAINIHHSFLPSFKGARPYHQAYDRGVKITGATAHYVTSDLDEGPIIEQDVQRMEHYYDANQMAQLGKHVETVVLAKAVYWHCQHKVLIHNNRTIVFK